MKKIKTFSVDEAIYNELLSLIKEHDAKASLSSFVNNCLSELLECLKEVDTIRQNNDWFKVPMSFIIGEMTKSLGNKRLVGTILAVTDQGIDLEKQYEVDLLSQWENVYEAQKLGISTEMYSHLKGGAYVLSSDKNYLIDKEKGRKFVVLPRQNYHDGLILEVKEE